MNRYVLLRIITEPSKEPLVPDEIVVKFFPVKDTYGPKIITAETPDAAMNIVRGLYPHLSHFFAIESEASYNATIARLAALSAKRRGGNPGGKTTRPERQTANAES